MALDALISATCPDAIFRWQALIKLLLPAAGDPCPLLRHTLRCL